MQTGIWMTYSDSMHSSEQFSYKILFILSYGLKDINYARFKHFSGIFQKTEKAGTFLTEKSASPGRWPLGPGRLTGRWKQSEHRFRMIAGATCQNRKMHQKKGLACASSGIRTQELLDRRTAHQPDGYRTDHVDVENAPN
jgi:hypothetical protein